MEDLHADRDLLRDHLTARAAALTEDALVPARLATEILGKG